MLHIYGYNSMEGYIPDSDESMSLEPLTFAAYLHQNFRQPALKRCKSFFVFISRCKFFFSYEKG